MKLIQKAIIKEGDKFLILFKSSNSKNFPNVWDFPGGKPERDEDLIKSLKREVFEETALKINVGNLIKTIKFRFKEIDRVYKIFSSEITSGNIKLSKEHSKFKWVSYDEIKNLNLHPFLERFFHIT